MTGEATGAHFTGALGQGVSIIFNDCLNEGKFPHEWKKANAVPVHKKGNKKSLKNYRPISLLPICNKIFERLICNEMFTFFTENNLISPNQSGFRPGDSCVDQLLVVTHEIYKSFDEGFEVRGVFLDTSLKLSIRNDMKTWRFTSQTRSKWYF